MVTNDDENPSTAEVSWQAAVWYLQLKDAPSVSLRVGWQFLRWLSRSPRHVRELILICRQDRQLTRMMQTKRDRSNVTHVYWWRGSAFKPSETRTQRHVAGWNLAATVLVLLPVAIFLTRLDVDTREDTAAPAATASKIRRLEDGSRVSLDAGSGLLVNFTDERRNVHLYQGRAMFDVTRDSGRPFVVNTFLVDISAASSTFAVKIDTSVEVSVHEGTVEVSRRWAKAGSPVITVKEGETYRVPVSGVRAIVAAGGKDLQTTLVDG